MILSLSPAETRFNELSSSSLKVGLITSSPPTNPILTAPIGPVKGISEIANAQEAPIIAGISESFWPSLESTIATT